MKALSLLVLFVFVGLSTAQNPVTAVTIDSLRVRAGAGTEFFLVGKLPPRTPVVVEGRNDVGNWAMIHTPDLSVRGWVALRYLDWDAPIDITTLPVLVEVIPTPEDQTLQQLKSLPIVASATARSYAIYQQGQALGNNPNRFTVVGDCQSVPNFFLGIFDTGTYSLGDRYTPLQSTIDHFAGSFNRERSTVYSGYTIYSVLDSVWSDPAVCNPGESPQECEYRLYKPAFAIISMEVWHGDPEQYEVALRQVLDFWIANGVVPILGTKADNYEGNYAINLQLTRIAQEYDIPLWNFFAAAQPLPNNGLIGNFHLTLGSNDFSDVANLAENAWPRRNLSALQSLDTVWRAVTGQPLQDWTAIGF